MRSKRGRLDRFLAGQLQLSKRQVRELLQQGRVWLDGCNDGQMDSQIDEFSQIKVDEQWLQRQQPVYWMLHKPAGVVSATTDPAQPTVCDCLPIEAQVPELHIAGRLDKYSTGLLLLTNDGRWSEALTLPSASKRKHYRVRVQQALDERYVQAFKDGFFFAYEGQMTAPAELTILSRHEALVVLTEGKYHQIKRMFGRFHNPVLALHRTQIGAIVLDEQLAPGQARPLTAVEIASVSLLHRE